MPRIVTLAGPNAALVTADVTEKQVLIAMEDEPETMWHHLLLQRLEGARWITCDPHLEVVVEDLAGERCHWCGMGPSQLWADRSSPCRSWTR